MYTTDEVNNKRKRGEKTMTIQENITLQKIRLNNLERRDKDNFGVCRKIRRNIRNLQKREA